VESSPGTQATREGARRQHATKQGAFSQATLKALDAIEYGESVPSATRARLVREGLVTEGGRLTDRGQAALDRRLAHEVLGRSHATKKSPTQIQREIDEVLSRPPSADPFGQAKSESAAIEAEVDAASEALRAFPRGPTGLTPDAVRATPEYRAAKSRYARAFARQRDFNETFTKRFAKELRAERAHRDAARQRR
jgi:hypothetical protein